MTSEEFEEVFGNIPFEELKKIKAFINKNYISKDKIRDKIKWFEEQENDKNYFKLTDTNWIQYNFGIELLKELLEE